MVIVPFSIRVSPADVQDQEYDTHEYEQYRPPDRDKTGKGTVGQAETERHKRHGENNDRYAGNDERDPASAAFTGGIGKEGYSRDDHKNGPDHSDGAFREPAFLQQDKNAGQADNDSRENAEVRGRSYKGPVDEKKADTDQWNGPETAEAGDVSRCPQEKRGPEEHEENTEHQSNMPLIFFHTFALPDSFYVSAELPESHRHRRFFLRFSAIKSTRYGAAVQHVRSVRTLCVLLDCLSPA